MLHALPNLSFVGGPVEPPTKSFKSQQSLVSQPPLISKWVVGAKSNRVSYCDEKNVSHDDDSLNTYLKVDSTRALRKDLVQEFGPEKNLCFPYMFSPLFRKGRFILCCKPGDAKHLDWRSPAHQFPKDYRSRIKRHFR